MDKIKEIIRKRAIEAAKVSQETILEDGFDVICFTLGNETYAIDTSYVSEVHSYVQPTVVPNTPEYIEGIVYLRGRFVSVIDFRHFFGIAKNDGDYVNSILFMENESMEFGLAVDEVLEEMKISHKSIQAVTPGFIQVKEDVVVGMCEDGLIVLDGNKMLTDEVMIIHEDI